MVRNPRTVMMCGLLGVAGALMLGGRLQAPADAGRGGIATRLASRNAWQPDAAAMPGPAHAMDADWVVDDAGRDGVRHPRGPRLSREAMAREAR
ncbi:MAG TPA: hypothetical protein VIG54_10630 [Lysobacter sp.]